MHPCGHVQHQHSHLGANFPYLSLAQQLLIWKCLFVLWELAVATEITQKHQHQLNPVSSLIWRLILISSSEIGQVIQSVCESWLCVHTCLNVHLPCTLSQAVPSGAQTQSRYVCFNTKRHIDPNGRVFVSPRHCLMLMSLWIIYLCVLFAFSSCSLKE